MSHRRLDTNSTVTGAHHPLTSDLAAHRILGRTGAARRRVMEAIAERDRTDEELQRDLNMAANTQRPRRVELVEDGLVVASGFTRPSLTGAPSIVWTATIPGHVALAVDESVKR